MCGMVVMQVMHMEPHEFSELEKVEATDDTAEASTSRPASGDHWLPLHQAYSLNRHMCLLCSCVRWRLFAMFTSALVPGHDTSPAIVLNLVGWWGGERGGSSMASHALGQA